MSQLSELLPPGSAVTADGTLSIPGCRADELAAQFGTPLMIVDVPALRGRAREYRSEQTSTTWVAVSGPGTATPIGRLLFASTWTPSSARRESIFRWVRR